MSLQKYVSDSAGRLSVQKIWNKSLTVCQPESDRRPEESADISWDFLSRCDGAFLSIIIKLNPLLS